MDAAEARIGLVLDARYRIVSLIAEGSMGAIYRAERLKLGRAVAVKVLHTPLADKESFLQRFEVEARALSRLGHPNCVSIIDFGVADAPYLVMDYVPGRTLKDVLEQGALPAPRAIHIFRQVLAGLAHAHGHGIVHRDIKPANVMLTEATGTGDHIRILDFGLAKLRSAALAAAREQSNPKVLGTPAYMSPEQVQGKEADVRSDIYSAGVMLFEMLSGVKPFETPHMMKVLNMHLHEAPPPLRRAAAGKKLSAEIEAVVSKAIAKKPKHRFQNALELAAALDETPEAALPLQRFYAQSSTRPLPATAKSTSRRSVAWVAVLLLFGAVAAVGAYLYYSGRWVF